VAIGGSGANYSQSVDIYAFGIIMWETLALKMPWHEKKYAFTSQILDAVESGKRPAVEPYLREGVPDGFVEIMKQCWSQDPRARPAFNRIAFALDDVAVEAYKDSHDSKRHSLRPTNASNLDKSLTSARRKHNAFRALKILDGPDSAKRDELTLSGGAVDGIELEMSGTDDNRRGL